MSALAHPRILMLLENLPFPQDFRVRREAAALSAGGYRVSLICPRASGQRFHEAIGGVRVYRYPAPVSATGFLGYAWEYGYAMVASFVLSVCVWIRDGFDVVHAHNPPDTFVFIAAFYKLFGKRFVYDHHDLSPEMYRAKLRNGGHAVVYHVLVWLERLTCRIADHVIVTNESYKRVAMRRCRVPASRITIVRNGIELSRLRRAVEPHRAVGRHSGTLIGYVGMMRYQDGVDYLLRALHHLRRDLNRHDFHCILIGGGDALPGLKALTERLGLNDRVAFLGPVFGDELLSYLSAADICVEPSPSNPYTDHSTMFKIMEYMSLGKPIVAFDLHEHRVTAQEAAVYVEPDDERAFGKALADLMDDPGRRHRLGAHGKRRIELELAWDYSIPRLLDAYRAVLPVSTPSWWMASPAADVAVRSRWSSLSSTQNHEANDRG